MATKHTITGSLTDFVGPIAYVDITAVVRTNLEQAVVLDSDTGSVHVGDGPVAILPTGDFTLDLLASNDPDLNVAGIRYWLDMSWTSALPTVAGGRPERQSISLGPFAVTGPARLVDLADQFDTPATSPVWRDQALADMNAAKTSALGQVTTAGNAALASVNGQVALAQTARAGAEVARAAAEGAAVAASSIALGSAEAALVAQIPVPSSPIGGALNAAIAKSVTGANASRFIRRAQSGEDLKVTVLGDSMWAGQTVTNPATDGAAILLANDLTARFPGTVTVTNRAFGGRTMLTLHTFGNIEDALADKADLYIIGGGRNDALSEFSGPGGDYKAGYPRAGSMAARERVIRMIRDRVPKADIMLTSEAPYLSSTSGNVVIRSAYDDVQRLAAQYGCEWVDVYAAVASRAGGYADLMHPDGVHPNTAGHRFMADLVLAHLPADYAGSVVSPATPGPLSTRKPGAADTTKGRLGYVVASAAGVTGLSLAKSGSGWSGTAPHVTTTAGDYIEYAFTGTEFHINLNNTNSASPVVFDVAVDGVTVATNVAPAVAGIAYYHPFAMGLAVGAHTVRVTLVSGTLSINQAAALVGPGSDVVGSSVLVDLTGTTSVLTLSTGGTVSYAANEVPVPLPAGWAAMDVDFSIWLQPRVTGETTTWREFQFILRRSTGGTLVPLTNWKDSFPPVSTGIVARKSATFTHTDAARTASQLYRLEAYATGTDKTSQFVDSWKFTAVCRRTA